MSQINPDIKNLSRKWLAEQLRFTIFPKTPIFSSDVLVDWAFALTNKHPDEIKSKPAEVFYSANGSGTFEEFNYNYLIESQIDRIHFRMVGDPTSESISSPWIALGLLDKIIKPFSSIANKIISLNAWPNEVKRIAFGTYLLFPVDDRQHGYAELDKLLKYINMDPQNSSDFIFQINRPKSSSYGKINRLSKWLTAINSGPILIKQEDQKINAQVSSNPSYAVKAILDISTFPSDKPIATSCEKQIEILNLLVAMAFEIADKGDH